MPEIPSFILERAQAQELIFVADEVATWPSGLLSQLVADDVLTPTSNATSVTCNACGDDHVELVQFVEAPPGSELRAYIACPDNCRVRVPLDRLRQWSVNLEVVQASADFEPSSSGFKLPDDVTITSTSSTEFLPTPSADGPKGLRDAADYCRAQAARPRKPTVDQDTFSVEFNGCRCELRNTKEFWLFERINRRPGQYFPNATLIQDVWNDEHTEKNTIQRTISNLRRKLRDAGIEGIEIDGTTNRGHYALKLSGR